MQKSLKVSIPSVPNYIKVGNEMISVKDFSRHELEEIGREWTDALVKKSGKVL